MGKKGGDSTDICIIIFVEGDTEKVFYNRLLQYLKEKYTLKRNIKKIKIKNLKGISKGGSKAPAKFRNGIKPKYPNHKFIIIFAYDTDEFEFKKKPPVNWPKVKRSLKNDGASKILQIKANRMIEDWFLLDIDGLCNYLNKKKPSSLKGKDGNKKMQNLFKKANKIYIKGTTCDDFIDKLDLDLICKSVKGELDKLINCLFDV